MERSLTYVLFSDYPSHSVEKARMQSLIWKSFKRSIDLFGSISLFRYSAGNKGPMCFDLGSVCEYEEVPAAMGVLLEGVVWSAEDVVIYVWCNLASAISTMEERP